MRNPGARPWQYALLAVVVGAAIVLTVAAVVVAQAWTRTTTQHASDVRAVSAAYQRTLAEDEAAVEARLLQVKFPAGSTLRIGVVGDSIAHGSYSSTADRGWPSLVRAGLSKYGTVSEEVDAVPGQVTKDALSRPIPSGADLLILELGTNDAARATGSAFAPAYEQMLSKVQHSSPDAALLCLGPWGNESSASTYEQTIEADCAKAGGHTVALSGLYADDSDHATQGGTFWGGRIPDSFHPNDAGHAAIAGLVLAALNVKR